MFKDTFTNYKVFMALRSENNKSMYLWGEGLQLECVFHIK